MNLAGKAFAEDRVLDRTLRPHSFEEYIGQSELKENLEIFVKAAVQRGERLFFDAALDKLAVEDEAVKAFVDKVKDLPEAEDEPILEDATPAQACRRPAATAMQRPCRRWLP